MKAHRIAPVLLGIALAVSGCASTRGNGMLAADAPRALPDAGPVSVAWNDPATFAEFRYNFNRHEAARGNWLTELASYLRKQAERKLASGERLELTIVDVDRAGEYEPGRDIALQDTRIVRDIYPPRMTVRFKHYDAAGSLLGEGERKISDLGFLTNASPMNSTDPLRYEKRMIDAWLRRELVTASR